MIKECIPRRKNTMAVFMHFADVTSMCIRGPVPPKGCKSMDYDRESALFAELMKANKMNSCKYLEIDFNARRVIGFDMKSEYKTETLKKMDKSCGKCGKIQDTMKRCSRC